MTSPSPFWWRLALCLNSLKRSSGVWKPCTQAVWGSDHSGSCSQFSFSEFNVPLLSLLYSNLLLKRLPSNTSSPCLPVDCQSPLSDSRADALLPSFYPASGWYAEGGQLLRQTKQACHGNQDRNIQQRSISVFIFFKNGAGCSYSVATSWSVCPSSETGCYLQEDQNSMTVGGVTTALRLQMDDALTFLGLFRNFQLPFTCWVDI